MFVFPILPYFPYSKREQKNRDKKHDCKKQMSMLCIFTFTSRNRLLMFSDVKGCLFFCLAQCMFNLYIDKSINRSLHVKIPLKLHRFSVFLF